MEHDKLFASIRNKEGLNDAEIGAKSTLSAIMGRMATYSGQMINWEQALASEKILMPQEVTWNSIPPTVPGADGNYPIPTPGKTIIF